MNKPTLLTVENLSTHFSVPVAGRLFRKRTIKAVDGVSFSLGKGEVLSLVGESGCGKTTVGRTITKLQAQTGGEVHFNGRNISALSNAEFRPLRRQIQMIFQDPYASLNPRLTIQKTLSEPLFIHKLVQNNVEATRKIASMLNQVGLDESAMKRHPHEFSGGQRQRIGIARVMIVEPELIVADEAVSALDVSIQAQVLNLLKKIQRTHGISMLFISHDLGVVRHISDRIAVMKAGKIVETATRHKLFTSPQHPYTKSLLASIPRIPDTRKADS